MQVLLVIRLIGLLLACLFLVAPGADALCRAGCTPVSAVPPCHDQVGSPDRLHPTSAASCQREVVIAAPVTDGRRELVAPATMLGDAADAVRRLAAATARDGARPHRPPARVSCPRRLVLRI